MEELWERNAVNIILQDELMSGNEAVQESVIFHLFIWETLCLLRLEPSSASGSAVFTPYLCGGCSKQSRGHTLTEIKGLKTTLEQGTAQTSAVNLCPPAPSSPTFQRMGC